MIALDNCQLPLTLNPQRSQSCLRAEHSNCLRSRTSAQFEAANTTKNITIVLDKYNNLWHVNIIGRSRFVYNPDVSSGRKTGLVNL